MASDHYSRKKALVPISVDNPGFSTSFMVSALSSINAKYDEFVFLVADDLQLYNKVATVRTGEELSRSLNVFKERNVYFEEKERWLKKVKENLPVTLQRVEWTITSISQFTDQKFYNIWRNLVILYQTIPQFRNDVTEAARQHFIGLKRDYSETQVRLSRFYIIEEIAINIRLRVCEGIYAEYYAFNYHQPLLKIYSGGYGIDVFSLANVNQVKFEFEFFKFTNLAIAHWDKVEL